MTQPTPYELEDLYQDDRNAPQRSWLSMWIAGGLALTGVGLIVAIPLGIVGTIIEGNMYHSQLQRYHNQQGVEE